MSESQPPVCVYAGEELASYNFGEDHPFGPDRFHAFWNRMRELGLDRQLCICKPVLAARSAIETFHTAEYVDWVIEASEIGTGYLDRGDTPAFAGVYEAASYVVGSTLDAVDRIIRGECTRAFVPIAGLHHAGRDQASGFCVFNDCGVVIETLRREYGIRRIAYVDIDAHHGNGVYYAFEADPELIIADFHEDGRYLYPGTGSVRESGRGLARGTKMNVPLPPGADDQLFARLWPKVEQFIDDARPEFILFQCGADSIAGDPITDLGLSTETHARVAASLCLIADRHSQGRLLACGGGGYDRRNLADAWSSVVQALLNHTSNG